MAPNPEPTDTTLTRRRRLTGVAILASASLLTTGGVALAGSGSGERPSLAAASHDLARDGVHGTVSAVGSGSFTVEGRTGSSREVLTTESTSFLDTTKAEVADVEVGANLVVAGPRSDDGSGIDATHLAVKPAPRSEAKSDDGGRHEASWRTGTVVANDGQTLTVDSGEKTLTVHTDEQTSVSITEKATFDDVTVGDRVTVRGDVADDGTVTAERVHLGAVGKDHDSDATTTTTAPTTTTTAAPTTTTPPETTTTAAEQAASEAAVQPTVVAGAVESVSAPSFTVKQRDGSTITVMTTEATAWGASHGRTGDRGGIESLDAGDLVFVKGTFAAGGTFVASFVDVKGDHDRHHGDWDDDGWRGDHHRDHEGRRGHHDGRGDWDDDGGHRDEWGDKDHDGRSRDGHHGSRHGNGHGDGDGHRGGRH